MNQLRSNMLLAFALILMSQSKVEAQTQTEEKYEVVFLAGLIQPLLLDGGNVEIEFYTPKFVCNYSHGFSLELTSENNTTSGEVQKQGLAFHLPYSTGFGVGYRLNKYFDIRFEPKLHKFEGYYDGKERTIAENRVVNYQTVTLGLGAYFRWKPFEKQNNFLRGIFTSTSIRYWQNVYSSLNEGEFTYENTFTSQTETHETLNIGIANTPWLFNVAFGYSISF